MKRAFLYISIAILLYGFTKPSIDYNHKKIGKQILKTYELTEFELLPESVADNYFRNGKLFYIMDAQEQKNNIYIGRVYSCRAGGCSINNSANQEGNAEYFDYMIMFNSSRSIKRVYVYSYKATHGHEVTAKSWLKQFNDYTGDSELSVGKNIDAISGATISVYAITDDITYVVEQIKRMTLNAESNKLEKEDISL